MIVVNWYTDEMAKWIPKILPTCEWLTVGALIINIASMALKALASSWSANTYLLNVLAISPSILMPVVTLNIILSISVLIISITRKPEPLLV